MANISVEQKAGGRNSWILMAVALLAVAGLMAWLAAATEDVDRTVAVDEGAAVDTASATAGGSAVALGAISAAPDTYAGRPVRVENVEVASKIGPRAFWALTDQGDRFLVTLGPAVADTTAIAQGQVVTVRGTVAPRTDALLDEWAQNGVIRPEARQDAGVASHYLQVEEVVGGAGATQAPTPQQPAAQQPGS